ncbi:uncharacterized protein LOC126997597 isoform X3 [Eriocheir sinensis]|nr:uncharacterized protein LOC126997597 isoform X3 [Eriocheir sinensis]XP_050714731.1 uncharacterized protein LOC126997597 isoform X3 [Eriocheir sinensis]XP_050714732.1 uncharacterized protein LOC126997597 isoform X3 [Eriocheir sinensis]XP_050714733.1 uncharacterized protein LOC126997597 isoform X3 [Eriocheir sinensis]
MMSEGGGGEGGASNGGDSCPPTHQVWLPLPHNDDDDEEEDEEGARGGGAGGGGGGEVVVVGSGGATTLYSREDGATVLEAADGTTTVLRPHGPAHRLTVTVEGGDGEAGEGMTAIVDGQAGTATLVEGAEVVRTQAVSYATPILHHVYLQATPTTPSLQPQPAATTTTSTPRKTPLVAPVILQTASSSVKEDVGSGRSGSSNSNTSSNKSRNTSLITSTSNTATSSSKSRVSSSNSSNSSSKSTKLGKGGDGVKTTTTASFNSTRHGSNTSTTTNNNSKVVVEDSATTAATTTITTTTTTTTSTCAPPDASNHHHHNTNHHHHLSHLHHHRHPSLSSSPSSTPPPSLSPPSSASGPRTDDELTSLSWLQDSNLLRGTALSPVKSSHGATGRGAAGEVVKAESPTSDYGDESSDALEPGELTLNDQPHTQPSRQQPIPYNPQVHINAKPPYSFSCLIFMAIEDSSNKALPVKDIYAWILDHFPYFRNAPTGWKNSVRHNLSLNKCFRKVEKAPNLGKGSLWMVDPAYRPNLLQALSKTPFHPYSNLDRIYLVSTKAGYNNKQLGEGASGQGSGTAAARPASTPVESPAASPIKPSGANVPDPELFPYLARRLGSSGPGAVGMEVVGSGVHSEDVDAAAAMLALKHGSRIVTPASGESYSQLRDGKDTSLLYEENRRRKRKRKHTEVGDARMMVISSSPSLDHSYTSVDGEEEYPGPTALPPPCRAAKTNPQPHPPPTKKANHSPTSSVDEAFSDDSYDSDVTSEASQADIRQLVEGADALLNLAAVATSLASQRHFPESVGSPAPPHMSAPSSCQNVPRIHHSPATPHLGRVHILKPSAARSASGKSGSKAKSEVAHNNNTILTNNNKVLKVKRFSSRASSRQQLSSSSH